MSKTPFGGTLLIEYDGKGMYRVIADGHDISNHITGLTAEIVPRKDPELSVDLVYGTVSGDPRFVARMVLAESEAAK